jgi:hypothetical protein
MMSTLQSDEWKNAYRDQAANAARRGREYGLWLLEESARDMLCATDIEEIVADALGDIWLGRVSWNHEAVGLTRAVQDVVRYRIRDRVERVAAHVPLGADGEPEADEDAADSCALGARDRERLTERLTTEDLRDTIERRDLARRAIADLQRRITEQDLQNLFDLLIAGMDGPRRPTRTELAERLDTDVEEVRLLERRLATCAAGLPANLRPDGFGEAVYFSMP